MMHEKKTPDQGPFPANSEGDKHETLLARALADYIDLCSAERSVDPAEFCRRHPQVEADLRVLLDTMAHIDDLLGGTLAPVAGAGDEPLPERLSGLKVLSVIGSGGMGRVYLAEDEGLGRKVAIKTLSPALRNDERLRDRFMQEARALARLSHPNIVRIYNLGQPDETPHFVMEYVHGSPLVEAARPLALEQKVELFRRIVLAVEYLHQFEIVHRDLKPGNILVGSDLEPKLLDFGLAKETRDLRHITRPGEVMGTPDYFSPEQARGEKELDARSDILSLGTILYELLAGVPPFRADSAADQIRLICETDPLLPRRLNPAVPGDLQNVCMKCLEKNAADRYGTARELADDLARYLADEPVLANPVSYSRMMSGRIEQHLRELRGWEQDRILSVYEYDAFRRLYGRLIEREDAWILEVRRLSLSQVALYLGAWTLVVGAALMFLFHYPWLAGSRAVAVVAAAAVPTAWIGIRCWKLQQKRIGVAFLLAFCLLLPATLLVAMKEWHILTHFTQGKENLELFARLGLSPPEGGGPFSGATNAQLWWSIVLSLPAYFWLRRFSSSSVFSLVLAVMGAILCGVMLLRMGMLDWFETDPGRVYFRLLPFAVLFFLAAACIERLKHPDDSRYFYPVAVLFTFVSLSGVALFHEPYANWLKSVFPKTRGQLEYLFIINAGIYLLIQNLSEHFGTAQMRNVAKAFRFVIPGHVLTSILLLGLVATDRWEKAITQADLRAEARFFEFLLPVAACLFVFGSVPKQMKNFFITGMLFLALGIVRLQQDFFKNRPSWPMTLLAVGLLLMILAANSTQVNLILRKIVERRRTRD
jgi:predicted Ser/Thr protein kinase